jgi:NAD(P)-dependent dehydrogenase (short-subunit alcohol dehydrogenase family)
VTRLAGKAAIVTGAGVGIGRASARRLAAEGARVAVVDVDAAGAEAVAEEIRAAGGEAFAHVTDVSEEAQVEAMVAAAVERWGRIDVLHNNAADTRTAQAKEGVELAELSVEAWNRAFDVNARGVMLGCKHAIPHMLERGGSIVHTSSVVSVAPHGVHAAYASSKGAVNSLTRSVATTYGPRGIRCNAIMPGFIVTESTQRLRDDAFREEVVGLTPLRRLGAPEDIAALVAFLAADESSFITGQVIAVDGGMTTPSRLYGTIGRRGS